MLSHCGLLLLLEIITERVYFTVSRCWSTESNLATCYSTWLYTAGSAAQHWSYTCATSLCRAQQGWHHQRGHHPCFPHLGSQRQTEVAHEGGDGSRTSWAQRPETHRGGPEERAPETGRDGDSPGSGSGKWEEPLLSTWVFLVVNRSLKLINHWAW